MTRKRKTWLWAAVLIPLGVLSAVGCGRVEVGVVETSAGTVDPVPQGFPLGNRPKEAEIRPI